ncbi:MAG: LarC family nickel insertion protein [Deferrisomatales bacterium]
MERHLHIHPCGGFSAEMLLAGLVHLGAAAEAVESAVQRIPVPGASDVQLAFEPAENEGIRGLRLRTAPETDPGTSRFGYAVLRDAVASAPLPAPAVRTALAALEALGEARAEVRGIGLDQVTLAELGGTATALRIVGACLAGELLGISSVSTGPLPLGPAAPGGAAPCWETSTLALLTGLPTVGVDAASVVVTPAGAALARTLATSFGPPPPMVLQAAGAGFAPAGPAAHPRFLQLLLGTPRGPRPGPETLRVLEANLDDLSPEILATLPEVCLEAGALDAWLTPILMKKGRPAHLLSALCREGEAGAVEEAIFLHSSTLGLRSLTVDRSCLGRSWEEAATPWGPVRVKVGVRGGRVVNRAPEFEDCRRLSREAGVPLKEVYAAALGGLRGRNPV